MVNASGVHRPKMILKHSATLFVFILLAYATFLISQSWREAKSDQSSRLATIADLSENALDMYFSQLEIGMRNLGADLSDSHKRLDLDRAFTLVNRFQGLHTELGNIMLIRSDGQILLTGKKPYSPDLPTLAKDSAFMKFRSELLQGPAFAIGQPVIGHIDNSWVISARYAVKDQSGKLGYILTANLPANMLQRYWEDSTLTRITALGLIRDDGFLVSRYPEPDAANLNDLYGKPVEDAMVDYLRANNYPQHGQVEFPGSNGKTSVLRVMRRLQSYPVTLFVEMPMTEIKAAWWHKMHAPYLLMALILAAIFAFYSISLRRRRTWSMAQRRELLRQNYEQALHERSPNEIFMFDANTLQFSYANDYALENLGYSLEQLQKKTLLSLHPEMNIESFGPMIEPLRRGEQESIKYQTVQARKDGSTYPVEVNLQLMASDAGGEGFLAIINDITALRQAEENIRKFNAPVERRATKRM